MRRHNGWELDKTRYSCSDMVNGRVDTKGIGQSGAVDLPPHPLTLHKIKHAGSPSQRCDVFPP